MEGRIGDAEDERSKEAEVEKPGEEMAEEPVHIYRMLRLESL
jgi:hypothetical protein